MATALADDTIAIHIDETSTRNDPDSSILKEDTGAGVATHEISFTGLAGAIFLILLFGLVFCMISFVGVGWSQMDYSLPNEEADSKLNVGLWETCVCDKDKQPTDAYFQAVQAMISIGLAGLLCALFFICLYLCTSLTCITKYVTILLVAGSSFWAVLFTFIGLVVFGAELQPSHTLSWSFYVSIIATFCSLFSGGLALVQFRRAQKS